MMAVKMSISCQLLTNLSKEGRKNAGTQKERGRERERERENALYYFFVGVIV